MKYPLLTFGAGIDDPSTFVLAEFRDRPSFLTNKFKTFAADFDCDVADRFTMRGRGFYRRFVFDPAASRRDSRYCSAFTCAPGTGGRPVTSALARPFNLSHPGNPQGKPNDRNV